MSDTKPTRPVIQTLWQNMKTFLFEPHSTITEVGAKHEARLIAVINFLFALSGLVGAVSIFSIDGLSRNVFVLIGLAILALIAYSLSRTRFHKIGSYLIVLSL